MTSTRVDPDGSAAALARYGAGLRRRRLVYVPVIGALVVALIVTVAVAWSHGEVAHTTLHTDAHPPSALSITAPSTTETLVWRTGDRAALGDPRSGGTVVVYGRHTVRGVDARTGRQTWSYTRTDRTVCAATQGNGTTVAVYEVGGNCDELTGLDSSTGRRRWTRTLDENGQPLDGHPSIQVLNDVVMFVTPGVIYTIQTDTDKPFDRWVYGRYGCSIHSAVMGSAGALISQTCTDPRCGQQKFCGRGPQLVLRSSNGASSTDTTNPDQITWNRIGDTDVPVSADGVLAALNPGNRTLDLFASSDGRATGVVTLSPAPAASGPISAVAAADFELVTVRGVAAALDGNPGRPLWSRRLTAPLTAVATTPAAGLTLADARVTTTTSRGAAVVDATTGTVAQQLVLTPAPAPGTSVYPLGSGQLVTGTDGTLAYR